MTCPVCGGKAEVIDSRKYIDHVLRRRKCVECHYSFTTIETDQDIYQRLKKKGKPTGKVDDHDSEN